MNLFLFVNGQKESLLQPFWNPVILNPAFAGIDNTNTLRTGNQFYRINSSETYNLFYATYDTYSDKLKGGIAFFFQQGLIGNRNISTTETGFAFAGFPMKTENGTIRFGMNANFLLATKQWWVQTLDKIMINKEEQQNPPGNDFFQYVVLKPRLGFLWNMEKVSWGLALGIPLHLSTAEDTLNSDSSPLNMTFFLARKTDGFRKGLHSKPYILNPELLVMYQEDLILSRLRVYIQHTNLTYGVFLQNDFTHNLHCVGGTFGIASRYTRLDLSAGAGIPGISDDPGFCFELTLHITVPRVDYSQIYPWATQSN